MKIEENKTHSIHLRLNDAQYSYLQSNAELLGVGVSETIRMMVNTVMVANNKLNEKFKTLGDLENENNKNNQ